MSITRFRQYAEAAAISLRNVVLGGNLASIALCRQPQRFVSYLAEVLFFYRSFTDTRGLPQKNVFEILAAGNGNSLHVNDVKLAWIPDQENWFHSVASYAIDIVSLCMLAQILKPALIFEIGTLRGYTSLHFALNSPPDARVYTLDLPSDAPVIPKLKTTVVDHFHIDAHGAARKYLFQGSDVENKITCLFGDSATFDYGPFLGKVDLFFIDGAHSYEYVRSDTLNALKCCHPGSVIAWHDFGRMGVNGVSRWLVGLSKEHQVYSVPGGSLAFMVVK